MSFNIKVLSCSLNRVTLVTTRELIYTKIENRTEYIVSFISWSGLELLAVPAPSHRENLLSVYTVEDVQVAPGYQYVLYHRTRLGVGLGGWEAQ